MTKASLRAATLAQAARATLHAQICAALATEPPAHTPDTPGGWRLVPTKGLGWEVEWAPRHYPHPSDRLAALARYKAAVEAVGLFCPSDVAAETQYLLVLPARAVPA